MSYSLNSVIINPSSKSNPKNAVILCHGYGGDGNDISILANYWKNFLPDTISYVPMLQKFVKLIPQVFNGLILWIKLMKKHYLNL